MRYGVVLALAVGLLALPASASRQTETVTVKVGQTIPLESVFDKKRQYRIVMSGLVTMTLKVGNQTHVYDPFYGAQDVNCTNSGPSVYLQIKDAARNLIDFSTAGKPPCRRDHRYEFVINDAYPPAWDLHGKAATYITLQPDLTYWTVGGSFKLVIEPEPREPVAVVRWRVAAKKAPNVVALAHLNGRGLMTTDRINEGGLADRARLVPEEAMNGELPHVEYLYEGVRSRRVEMEITSGQLVIQGRAGDQRIALQLIVEVVDSDKPGCAERTKTRRGARGTLLLVDYTGGAPNRFVNTRLDLPCGVNEDWLDDDSNVRISVDRLKKKP